MSDGDAINRPSLGEAPEAPWKGETADALSGLAWELDGEDAELKPGDSLGRYKLEELIGEGAFGLVFLASQEEPVRRRVALKLLKLGMDTSRVVRRFRAERQMLASLDHPGVSRIYDAGATTSGRPYFVMEYVPGEPITAFCDSRRVGLEDRIRLLMEVCDAVQHAHQRGVIHRDLKPSNVLVREEPTGFRAKLIDLGVAKAMGGDDLGLTVGPSMVTGAGAMLGTPGYMSPEQAGVTDAAVDTRADIYALGVLLCELMTGALPVEPPRKACTAETVRTILASSEARGALDLIPSGGSEAKRALRARACDRGHIKRVLRGGIAAVIAKCTSTDPEERYPSASELAADLNRYLRGEPVTAKTRSYRSKAIGVVRKRQAMMLVGAAFLGGVLAGVWLSRMGFL